MRTLHVLAVVVLFGVVSGGGARMVETRDASRSVTNAFQRAVVDCIGPGGDLS